MPRATQEQISCFICRLWPAAPTPCSPPRGTAGPEPAADTELDRGADSRGRSRSRFCFFRKRRQAATPSPPSQVTLGKSLVAGPRPKPRSRKPRLHRLYACSSVPSPRLPLSWACTSSPIRATAKSGGLGGVSGSVITLLGAPRLRELSSLSQRVSDLKTGQNLPGNRYLSAALKSANKR